MIKRAFNMLRGPGALAGWALLIAGGIGGIVFWGGFNTFMEWTNTYAFCTSCHEMSTVKAEYEKSPHAGNASGVPAICSDCHVPRSWTAKLIRKVKASNELLHKVLGTIDTPEKFEAKRLALARNVWKTMGETDSRECRNCHSPATMILKGQSDMAAKWHKRELQTGKQTCIHCHKGIAHKLPNLVKTYDDALAAIKAGAGANAGGMAAAILPARLRKEEKADSLVLADIDAGTEVTVVEIKGDLAKVRLTAWDREQSTTLYEALAVPIRALKLTIDGMDHIKIGKIGIDKRTELEWRRITVEGWLDKSALTPESAAIWNYAGQLYNGDCGLCHKVPEFNLWEVNEWPVRVKRMRRYTQLDLNRQALVSRYLQRNTTKNRD